jgi:hypothetical protein
MAAEQRRLRRPVEAVLASVAERGQQPIGDRITEGIAEDGQGAGLAVGSDD